ncbi:hypothetical protein HDU96_008426 [Phlyctochytrium bullatum]|nr:hypothetical protein HDU96_008426 [Phlyctochytrium bullatum]
MLVRGGGHAAGWMLADARDAVPIGLTPNFSTLHETIQAEEYRMEDDASLNASKRKADEAGSDADSIPSPTKDKKPRLSAEVIEDRIIIVDYKERSIALFGDTRPVKDKIKELGGKFNKYLTLEGKKEPGWIMAKTKKSEIVALLRHSRKPLRVDGVDYDPDAQPPPPSSEPPSATYGIDIILYGENQIAAIGNTAPYKDKLKEAGGTFKLYIDFQKERHKGWVFPKANFEKIVNLLGKDKIYDRTGDVVSSDSTQENSPPPAPTTNPLASKQLILVDYKKSVAVFGDTKPIKDKLMELGGKFNKYLTGPSGRKEAGWIFKATEKEKVEAYLSTLR